MVFDKAPEEGKPVNTVGAGRQHNGRLGKIEMSQVGVFLALALPEVLPWIDGELYLPKAWFEESHAELRNKTGVPEKLIFPDQARVQLTDHSSEPRNDTSIQPW